MQEKYYVINSENEHYEFNSWYELIKELRRFDLYQIGHNFNDTYHIKKFKYDRLYSKLIKIDFIVFDSLWRVVDKSVIEKGFEDFVYRRRIFRPKFFEYRKEPVPHTGGGGRFYGHHIFRKRQKNKRAAVLLKEDQDLFPNDSSGNERVNLVKSWNDDLSMRCQDKSWKHNSKKRKQWM